MKKALVLLFVLSLLVVVHARRSRRARWRPDAVSSHVRGQVHSLVGDEWDAHTLDGRYGEPVSAGPERLVERDEDEMSVPCGRMRRHLPWKRSSGFFARTRLGDDLEDELTALGAWGLELVCEDCDERHVTVPVVQLYAVDDWEIVATAIARPGASYVFDLDTQLPVRKDRRSIQIGIGEGFPQRLAPTDGETFVHWVLRVRHEPGYELVPANPPARRLMAALPMTQ